MAKTPPFSLCNEFCVGGGGASGAKVQSDYNQNDKTKPDYIKNKPSIKNSEHGGMVLDNTEVNKAYSPRAIVSGDRSTVGSLGYKMTTISNVEASVAMIALTSLEGLKVGQRVNIRTTNPHINVGAITDIYPENFAIEVKYDTPQTIEYEEDTVDEPDKSKMYNYLTVVDHPELGNIFIGFNSLAVGEECMVLEKDGVAFGRKTIVCGEYGFAANRGNKAGYAAASFGLNTKALANCTFTTGIGTEATGIGASAKGEKTKAPGMFSSAEGTESQSPGMYSHAQNRKTISSGDYSHSEGSETESIGVASHAQNALTKAIGNYSSAGGIETKSIGKASNSWGTQTESIGENSHSDGFKTKSRGYCAVSDGVETEANGYASSSHGYHTVADSDYQSVRGTYNEIDSEGKYLDMVGNGYSPSNRSNAYTLDKQGNVWFAGNVECAGVILKSPNGTRFKVTVSDDGTLTTSKM